ncbi:MAG TPA: PIG-L family deacetylase [Proteobacteria bacterium]|nr:PIG-L family deacetylase [Pseudomonadota bacterium]
MCGTKRGEEAMGDSVLIFSAHADDAEFFCGGTIAKLASKGYDVYEVITTNNERGSYELDSATLVSQSRDKEAREAARILGKKDVFFLEYPDGFLADYPINEIREKFIRFIRRLKPRIVFTFDPWAPNEPHPDHRVVATAAMEAVSFAQMPLFHPEHKDEGLQPHLVTEIYYFAKDPVRANKVVDIGEFIDKKIDALCAHDSQMKLMIDDITLTMKALGMDPEKVALLDRDNYRPAVEMFIRAWANKVGAKAGVEYGEEFRYEQAGELIRELTDLL